MARALLAMLCCCSVAYAEPTSELSPETQVFWNARLALRAGKPQDALRLWLLRNALESRGDATPNDDQFRSAVWVALGETGFCPDGFIEDDRGAGLWPLAIHNWLLKNSRRQSFAGQPDAWGAFAGGAQVRPFSLYDVLSVEEMKTSRFFRANCWMQWQMMLRLPQLHWIDLNDRLSTGIMMRDLLELAITTLHQDQMQGQAMLQIRLFDINAALTKLAEAKVKRESSLLEDLARAAGVSEAGNELMRSQRIEQFRGTGAVRLWRSSMTWSASEWLSITQQRRLSLFGAAQSGLGDPQASDAVITRVIDELIERKDGKEVGSWLGFAGANDNRAMMTTMTAGERGEKLLGLEPSTGFVERSTVALHRGIASVSAGDLLAALRSFAFALGHSDESTDAEEVHRLSRRWLSFVLSQFDSDDNIMAILAEFVPPADTNSVLEVLVWRSAFHADVESFERVRAAIRPGGQLQRTVALLAPLASGNPGTMWREAEAKLANEPRSLFVFAERLVEQLSLEPIDVRSDNRATLELAADVLTTMTAINNKALQKKIVALQARITSLRNTLGEYDDSVLGRAKAGTPSRESYAGSVRLAPADKTPWPFPVPQVLAPDPFTPVLLTPIEWRETADGPLVYGWRMHE